MSKKNFSNSLRCFCSGVLTLAAALSAMGGIKVDSVKVAGPFAVHKPLMIDTVNAKQQKLADAFALDAFVNTDAVRNGKAATLDALNADIAQNGQLLMAGFDLVLDNFAKVEIKADGPKQKKVYVDGKEVSGKKDYQRGRYEVVVKYLADTAALSISVEAGDSAMLRVQTPNATAKRPFSLDDVMEMKHYTGLSVSPSGKYATISTYWSDHEGRSQRRNEVIEVATRHSWTPPQGGLRWMPKTDRLMGVRTESGRKSLVSYDPTDFSEQVLCADMPVDYYVMAPTEDFLILTKTENGPDKESGVYEVLTPDDRQPGWRNRSNLLRLDLATGIVQPLTFGSHNVYLADIAQDGSYIVFSVHEEVLGKRPTEVNSAYRLNLNTLRCDTLFERDGFVGEMSIIPGTDKLVIKGSPEAFNRIGCTLPDNLTPNTYDYQLFLLDMNTKAVKSLTRDFDPAISNFKCVQDGSAVYFTAENGDSVSLYRYDVARDKITFVPQPMELVQSFDFSNDAATLLYYGSSPCVAEQLYQLEGKKQKPLLLGEADPERVQNVAVGTCHDLKIQSKRGYPLTAFYYLPPNFDPTKKYPVIVHYYGGCTPTSRRYGGGSHYPAHYWNAMGYIVINCNPSGAAGFGQEWASRHVNTMGEGVAEDIIELTQALAENPWVDTDHIGCVSASYGGFMTQLLLTKTDMFAAGISHAGISDHTSYWGEGYWGYTYSQVCAANSYPWTRKDLFVDRSPLYNADKIHTPILFTHGTADTNVPVGESIQMYTALKLLGVPTAFVLVEGENHGIMDFNKRKKWINTMVAWFDRYLKEQPAWWNAIYTPKDL